MCMALHKPCWWRTEHPGCSDKGIQVNLLTFGSLKYNVVNFQKWCGWHRVWADTGDYMWSYQVLNLNLVKKLRFILDGSRMSCEAQPLEKLSLLCVRVMWTWRKSAPWDHYAGVAKLKNPIPRINWLVLIGILSGFSARRTEDLVAGRFCGWHACRHNSLD